MSPAFLRVVRWRLPFACASVLLPALLHAQAVGGVSGRVVKTDDKAPLGGVSVTIQSIRASTVTGTDGRFALRRLAPGTYVVTFRWVGYAPVERRVTVEAGKSSTLDVALEAAPVSLNEITVTGASRAPEKLVEAPSAISFVEPQVIQSAAVTGQAPVAIQNVPGVDIAQNGMNDFNVNTRGFNRSLNRRVLTLLDGRDLAIAFLGNQEWNGLPVPLEDLAKIELVRGPGSALYGNNAFNGVLNMATPLARDTKGARLSVGGGELSSYRIDFRYAGTTSEDRIGYRIGGGYNAGDTWSRSRTAVDGQDLRREYAQVGGVAPAPLGIELQPLGGQTKTAGTGVATGDRDLLKNGYVNGRLDFYQRDGSVITVEGGVSRVQNETFVTGIGRVQVPQATKPYARVAWNAQRFSLLAWWNGRNSDSAQISLASGANLQEKSNIFHIEGQTNLDFDHGNGRVIVGSSFRSTNVNTQGTLMRLANDDRSDWLAAGYAQIEYKLSKEVRLVGASRFDKGNLFDGQFSPKLAAVWSPNENHSVHASVNRAFQTPNYSEWFLSASAGAPANFTALEAGLRASALGPALAGVPSGQLFTTSSAVPVRAEGNPGLAPEEVLGFELGYKGNITKRAFVTVDLYAARLRNFVTSLLPGVNPLYQPWSAPAAVPSQFRSSLETAVRAGLLGAGQSLAASGLSRLPDGSTAIVVSYANAGEVQQRGAEIGAGYQFTDEVRLDGSVTLFDYSVKSAAVGDSLLPNTPAQKGNISLSYIGVKNGFDFNASMRLASGFNWASGVFAGPMPSQQQLTVSAGYRVNNNLRLSVIGTNLTNNLVYNLYGGAVIGRRIVGGVTATF